MDIVLFGDSHLGRFGKSQVELLESLIPGSIVYNCAMGGATSEDGVVRAKFMGQLQPDVVIVSYKGNDVSPWKKITPKEKYLQNMRAVFEAFPYSRKILFSSPDVELADATQTEKYNQRATKYAEALLPVCDELGVVIVHGQDVVSAMNEVHHEPDGVHMTEPAYREVIYTLATAVLSL